MKIIPPKVVTDAMLLSCSLAEPDPATSEVGVERHGDLRAGDQRYVGAPTIRRHDRARHAGGVHLGERTACRSIRRSWSRPRARCRRASSPAQPTTCARA
jgi:hypothetical protein